MIFILILSSFPTSCPAFYDDEESEGDVRILRVPFKPVRKRYGNSRRTINLDIDQLMPNSVYYLALRYNYKKISSNDYDDSAIVVSDYTPGQSF